MGEQVGTGAAGMEVIDGPGSLGGGIGIDWGWFEGSWWWAYHDPIGGLGW